MDRRQFLQQSSLAALGLTLSPTLLASCSKYQLFDDINFDGKVLIIGGGVAGMYAGHILKERGIEFEILEASDKLGGRFGRVDDFADFPIDRGAQWLHGKRSIIGDLIKRTGTKITYDNSEMTGWHNGEIVSNIPSSVRKTMLNPDSNEDISYKDFAISQGIWDEYKYFVETLAGDYGADASELSVKWNAVEGDNWSSGLLNYKFEDTYFGVFEKHIIPSLEGKTRLNTVVSNIDYTSDIIEVADSDGNIFSGDKLLITVPLTILQNGDIEFTPSLSKEKTEAFNKIGMGAGMKVFLKFSEKFYGGNIAGGEVCAAYADETVGKVGNDNVLLAFVMGHQAEHLTSLGSEDAINQALLGELDTMFNGVASQSFISAHHENWTTHPHIRGAYSFSKVGQGNAREIAAASVENKIFFAGEAMNLEGHHATVHGAAESSITALLEISKNA